MLQEGRRVSAAEVTQALRASATPFRGETVLDDGAGLPRLAAGYRWLLGGHQGSAYLVRAPGGSGASAAFRRDGLAGPGDTLQLFRVRHVAGLRAARGDASGHGALARFGRAARHRAAIRAERPAVP